ncbi:MAG: phosphoribosylaminoimidazolesuccinocarboxamide synthase [Nitrospirae bacterium CG_4_10_14_3_um_filter_44_29]|nr:phosphoribosylaminoimidazolesuccinocarboxamide synthase [Nitrospirota bacterium]OIO29254.1 MAG: phosphoribosylaminoimidazolesuccinocarboxamide synthase [Nitrospirae bacterium CG1_02_44_142]PIP69342.1 MAG: phosphoribosylaminoimidazolesuccinocarboxamide synthase [Nitrospirae bacterium CG22_combo_CG10-13_8_21_14_all_44_11]PIV43867.1 MAG: phosphoribosylaminoimidazolesuccinocarboxamide synthase [Nitrospirae bacterium CG02_land_8_20_14_3_00_44_33]PIV65951.1 MAG: phosphoribosylaminoimidazolesuccino
MVQVLMETDLQDVKFLRRGKVRDVYEIDDYLLIIATDRVSAFDVVLPNGIAGKGRVLTQISLYWFNQMKDIIENHIVATDVKDYPKVLHKYKDLLEGRSMLVKKARPMPVECIVRGYLSGSGWKEYKESGTVCGIKLPDGLVESARLDEPLFTPSTKAEEGHDINISFDETRKIVGDDTASTLRNTSLRVYKKARELAEKKGIIIADTKMEFGVYKDSRFKIQDSKNQEGKLILIDEILTPDSSRFWSMKDYKPGKSQDSFDKQIVRDYLLTLDWNQTYPGPKLPDEIIEKTAARYREILRILTG